MVTHDQNEALAVGDRLAVMRAGRIVQLDTPERVFHEPVDRFVAAFMGEASFLPWAVAAAEITGIDGHEAPHALAMIRPDDVTFAVEPDGETSVDAAEFRGSSWCYTLRLPSGGTVRSLQTHLERVAVGSRVRPTMRPGHVPVAVADD